MKEWEKHLERAEEKLRAANLLLERVWQKRKQSVKKQIMTYISSHPKKKKPKILLKMRRSFLERIKRALEELK